jgi:hypothetical protein
MRTIRATGKNRAWTENDKRTKMKIRLALRLTVPRGHSLVHHSARAVQPTANVTTSPAPTVSDSDRFAADQRRHSVNDEIIMRCTVV